MAQQTALDWYIYKINEPTFEASIHFQLFKEGNEYEQAKAMEKEQMNEIHLDGIEQGYNMRYQQEKKMQDDKDV
jgi:hypothetical protein